MTVVNTPVISCSDMPLGGDVVSNVGITIQKFGVCKIFFEVSYTVKKYYHDL